MTVQEATQLVPKQPAYVLIPGAVRTHVSSAEVAGVCAIGPIAFVDVNVGGHREVVCADRVFTNRALAIETAHTYRFV